MRTSVKESLSGKAPRSSRRRGVVSVFGHPPDKTLKHFALAWPGPITSPMICSIKGLCKPWRPMLPGHVILYDLNFMCAILSVCSNKVLSPLLMLSKGRPANKRARGLLHMQLIVLYCSLQTKVIKSVFVLTGQSGLGKSTLVNTLFKSKVSRKSCTPNYEEKISKTVHLQSVSHSEYWTLLSSQPPHHTPVTPKRSRFCLFAQPCLPLLVIS